MGGPISILGPFSLLFFFFSFLNSKISFQMAFGGRVIIMYVLYRCIYILLHMSSVCVCVWEKGGDWVVEGMFFF